MRRVCVFCGSHAGVLPEYSAAATNVGEVLAQRTYTVVYGAGGTGLMGCVADGALRAGGDVIGVVPKWFDGREWLHPDLSSLHTVATMAERKQMMLDMADACLTLPGGIGTIDEFAEVWTGGVLGMHGKPIGLLNVAGYYDSFLAFLERSVSHGFIRPHDHANLVIDDDINRLLDRLNQMCVEKPQRNVTA